MIRFIGNHQVNLDAGQRRNAERIQKAGIRDKIRRLNMNGFLADEIILIYPFLMCSYLESGPLVTI